MFNDAPSLALQTGDAAASQLSETVAPAVAIAPARDRRRRFGIGRRTSTRLYAAVIGVVALAVGAFAGAMLTSKWDGLRRKAQITWIDLSGPGTISIPAFGTARKQRARFAAAPAKAPLVIDLHQWSEDQHGTLGDDTRLDLAVTSRGWNYIRPALSGPNNNSRACCARPVIDGMRAAIRYAVEHGKVDRRAIYVVGESGGGYTGLCGAQSGVLPVRAYFIWVPITDLANWHSVHRYDRYGDDIMACTASEGMLNVAEARRRSPMYMPLPAHMPRLNLFHGIRDGMATSVSPEQTIRYFNRVAGATGHADARIPDAVGNEVMYARSGPEEALGHKLGDRAIHLFRRAGTTTLTLFEGNHEGLIGPTMRDLDRDWGRISSRNAEAAGVTSH